MAIFMAETQALGKEVRCGRYRGIDFGTDSDRIHERRGVVKDEWADFWVTIAMRFVGGIILGALAGVVLGHRLILRWLARDGMASVGVWLGAWSLAGGVVAVLRTPQWKTPWYKGVPRSGQQRLTPRATPNAATDLYGFESGDVDQAKAALESALGIQLEGRYSDYLGEHYHGTLASGVLLQLRRNEEPQQADPPQERYAEPEFPSYPILLYASGPFLDEARQLLEQSVIGILFLQRRVATGELTVE
jgi:hypothetical protein